MVTMRFKRTTLEGLLIIENDIFDDERGQLAKLYDEQFFSEHKMAFHFTQVKHTYTQKKGTIRGLHMQKAPHEEDKIVLCMKGKIFDVALDVRSGSKTYGKWFGMEFSDKEKKGFFIPKGFAHGYQSLTNDTEVLYLLSGEFSFEHNVGFRWDDPHFAIPWPLKPTVIADKDRTWPLFR
jgi:dTDP-4-dehydrorhamnose 3,5-epimerase